MLEQAANQNQRCH